MCGNLELFWGGQQFGILGGLFHECTQVEHGPVQRAFSCVEAGEQKQILGGFLQHAGFLQEAHEQAFMFLGAMPCAQRILDLPSHDGEGRAQFM